MPFYCQTGGTPPSCPHVFNRFYNHLWTNGCTYIKKERKKENLLYLYVVLQSKLADTWRGVDQLLQTSVQTQRPVLGSWPCQRATFQLSEGHMAHFSELSACLHLLQYLPLRHWPGITRDGASSHVTFLFFTRDCVNSILYTSWSSYKLLLSMLRFLFTVLTIFLPLHEFQAEVFLRVAAETIPPPHRWTSPVAVTEGGDTPNEMPGCHTSSPLPTSHHSWEATGAAGGPPRWPGCTSVLPPPCDGQPSASASGVHDPVSLRKDACTQPHNTTTPLTVPRHWFSLRFGESYSDVYPQTWIQVEFCRVRECQHKMISMMQQKGN